MRFIIEKFDNRNVKLSVKNDKLKSGYKVLGYYASPEGLVKGIYREMVYNELFGKLTKSDLKEIEKMIKECEQEAVKLVKEYYNENK